MSELSIKVVIGGRTPLLSTEMKKRKLEKQFQKLKKM